MFVMVDVRFLMFSIQLRAEFTSISESNISQVMDTKIEGLSIFLIEFWLIRIVTL